LVIAACCQRSPWRLVEGQQLTFRLALLLLLRLLLLRLWWGLLQLGLLQLGLLLPLEFMCQVWLTLLLVLLLLLLLSSLQQLLCCLTACRQHVSLPNVQPLSY
jgi:hypothetical protein